MRVFLAFSSALLFAAGAGVTLCSCGEGRGPGFSPPSFDASVRVPAEASIGAPVGPDLDAGCFGCPPLADGGTCPATWGEAIGVDAGVLGCPALECGYPEGTCVCFWGCGDPGARVFAVGGDWSCTPVTPECPSPRPQSGTPCGDAGPYCHYGPLCCEGSWTMECAGGLWDGIPGMFCP
jgi:hypothetical protein